MKTQVNNSKYFNRRCADYAAIQPLNEWLVCRLSPTFTPFLKAGEIDYHGVASKLSEFGVHNRNRATITEENKHLFDLTYLISNFDRPTPHELRLRYKTTLAASIARNRDSILVDEILAGAMAKNRHHNGLLLWLE